MADEAVRQCEEKLADAHREAERIVEEARRTVARRHTNAVDQARVELDQAAERARRLAKVEADKIDQAAKHAVTEDVLGRVRQELARLAADDEAFSPVLEALLGELLPEMREGMVVLAPPGHVERCRSCLRRHGMDAILVEGRPDWTDGVAVQDLERTFRTSNTLSGRFAKLEAEARKLCVTCLTGEDGQP